MIHFDNYDFLLEAEIQFQDIFLNFFKDPIGVVGVDVAGDEVTNFTFCSPKS